MTTTARRNATYYGGDLRRDLLDAALDVVAREGTAAVNLRALARRLGVSHAAPANHFTDKTALFTAIAQEGFELMGRAMTTAMAAVPADAPAADRLQANGRAYLMFAVAHRAHFEVMWRRDLLADDPGLEAASMSTFESLTGAIGQAQATGWAAGADERTLAYLSWAFVHGLAVLWLSGPLPQLEDRPFADVADAVGTLFNHALAGSTPDRHPEGDSDA